MNANVALPRIPAELLKQDPRITQAKNLILEVVREHQQPLQGVRPPLVDLAFDYQQLLADFASLRGGALYFPYLSSGIGNGPYVQLLDGSVKLDFITGIGVHGFGHSHPLIIEAGLDAALADTGMQGNLQQGLESYQTMKLLTEVANESGAKLVHCFFSSSGAMANENALKIAFQKNAPANRVIAFEHCFAGRTLALSQITDKAANRVGMPDNIAVDYLPFFDAQDPAGSTERALSCLKELIQRYPGKHALLWLELIQGEGGYYVGDQKFFRVLMSVARKHGLAIVVDEVQTFARTSRPFAFQHFELDDWVDVVTIGKISQVCATFYTSEYQPQPGLISQTFTGSSWSIIAAARILNALRENGHFGPDGRNEQIFQRFAAGLEGIAQRHPDCVSGPFGIGGMVAFTPLDGSVPKARDVVNRLYQLGLMSFLAGANPTRVRFLIPIGAVQDDHLDEACRIIEQGVVDVQNSN